MSGKIDASIYPLVQANNARSDIDVRYVSGSASVTLYPLFNSPQSSIKALSARFSSASGKLEVRFPTTWEGEIISRLKSGKFRHDWEGLRVLEEGRNFRASNGNGGGQLYIEGASSNVELRATTVAFFAMPFFARGENWGQEREHVPAVPGTPGSRREVGTQTSNPVHDSPEEGPQRKGEAEDDDDWTVISDEDGAPEVTRQSLPSYEDAVKR